MSKRIRLDRYRIDRERVEGNIGRLAYLNRRGDILFEKTTYGPYIGTYAPRLLRIIKVTKGGRAYLCDWRRRRLRFSVDVRNVEIL